MVLPLGRVSASPGPYLQLSAQSLAQNSAGVPCQPLRFKPPLLPPPLAHQAASRSNERLVVLLNWGPSEAIKC